jgi:ATP-dependent Lhr-like helicase
VAAAAWERDILGPRVAGYRPEWLDDLCLAGEVAWARLSPRRAISTAPGSTSRSTPITLALRRDLGWLLEAVRGPADPEAPSAEGAVAALDVLRRRGALFLDDLGEATRLPRAELADALWDLVGRGLVAGDGFRPLRELMTAGRASQRRARPAHGRWAVVARPEAAGAGSEDVADRLAAQLLARYGVVFRDLLARENFAIPWRDVLRALRRREARGLARGGRFVSGFVGEQYALEQSVEALRRIRREPREGVIVRVRASDPCNLVGIVVPGARVPSHHAQWVVYEDGAFARTEGRDSSERTTDRRSADRIRIPQSPVPSLSSLGRAR